VGIVHPCPFIRPYLRTSGRYTCTPLAAGNGDWMGGRCRLRFGVAGSSCASSNAHSGAPCALLKRNCSGCL
jgi:hypothetical protein